MFDVWVIFSQTRVGCLQEWRKKMASKLVVAIVMMAILQTVSPLVLAKDIRGYFAQNNQASDAVVDHEEFNQFLSQRILSLEDGVNRLHYREILKDNKDVLKPYLAQMAQIEVTNYNRKEQLAYWINLYNAIVINMVLQEYPIKTIKDVKSPWRSKQITVENHALSLDNIEHGIIRAVFQDFRIHFAINSAAYGSGVLRQTVYTGDNLERNLEQVTKEFLSHDRGLSITGKRVQVSTIFKWYRDDFGDSDAGILALIKRYTSDAKRTQLGNRKIVRFNYKFDWQLNDIANMFQ